MLLCVIDIFFLIKVVDAVVSFVNFYLAEAAIGMFAFSSEFDF